MKAEGKLAKKIQKGFDKKSIGKSLRNSFLTIIIMFAVATIGGVFAISDMAGRINTMDETYLTIVDASWKARRNLLADENALFKMCLAKDKELKNSYNAEIDKCYADFELALKEIEEITPEFDSELSAIRQDAKKIQQMQNEIRALIAEGSITPAVKRLDEEFIPTAENLNTKLLAIADSVHEKTDLYVEVTNILKYIVCILMLLLMFGGLGAALWLAKLNVRKIATPLTEIEGAMDCMRQGNLDFEIEYHSENELGKTAHAVRSTRNELHKYITSIDEVLQKLSEKNFDVTVDIEYRGMFNNIKTSLLTIIEALNHVMYTITSTTFGVEKEAQQIENVAQNLAQGASEQASTVEELLATVQGVSEQVKINAQNVGMVSHKATESKNTVDMGNEQMEELVTAMEEISKTSAQISEILTVIEGISGQTNLLALNASIEAARAGEAGKGFAVVATEIGELANKTKEATKTTEELINGSLIAVEKGNKIVIGTAELLKKVVTSSSEITDLTEEVAEASKTQAEALGQIENAVEQISEVVQQNTGLAQEAAASSGELNSHVEHLADVVREFSLKKK